LYAGTGSYTKVAGVLNEEVPTYEMTACGVFRKGSRTRTGTSCNIATKVQGNYARVSERHDLLITDADFSVIEHRAAD